MPTYELRWEARLVKAVAAAIGKTCRDNKPPKDQLLHTVNALVTVIGSTALLYPSMTKPEEQQVCVDLVAARLKASLTTGRWTRLASKGVPDQLQKAAPRESQRRQRLLSPAA